MKKIITYTLLLVVHLTLQAQFSSQKEKYWIYRERLKNFMVSSHGAVCKGCDIPARDRKNNTVTAITGADPLKWADSPWFTGYWIGTLAMEYKLLTDAGLSSTSTEVMQTKEDLYGAIQSINRLDWEAEVSWDNSLGCNNCNDNINPCIENLNGFLISDDIPMDFSQVQTIIDGLNEGLVPPPDDYRDKCISSAYTEYLTPGREASYDHLIGLYMGLTLVKKCLPATESWDNTLFIDEYGNTTSFVTEVQIISNRIINYLNSNSWIYMNPCTYLCVLGVGNQRVQSCGNDCTIPASDGGCPGSACFWNIPIGDEPQCCEAGGALALPEAIGFAAVNKFIQENGSYETFSNAIFEILVSNPVYQLAWNQAINDGNRLVMTLVALGNIWKVGTCWEEVLVYLLLFHNCPVHILVPVPCSSTTADISDHLVNAGVNNHWEHLYLLHKLLYGGGTSSIDDSYYECLLDAAPCRGYDGTFSQQSNVEWSHNDRLIGDRDEQLSDACSRVDYMFYFNIFYLNQFQSSFSYLPIPSIHEIALNDIVKSNNYIEYDKKNFEAANTITAYNYTIASDPIEGQGRVTFAAGNKITLGNGFKVTNGAYFRGYIDPTIGAMDCTEPVITDCSGFEKIVSHIPDTITDADSILVHYTPPSDTSSIVTMPCPVDTLHFNGKQVDSNAVSFAWDFGNGQTSVLENPFVFYSSPGTFIITLITTDIYGVKDTISGAINVPDCNDTSLTQKINNTQNSSENSSILYSYLKIFPNPNNGNMNVEYEIQDSKTGEIQIYDALGRNIFSHELYGGKNSFVIDDENFIEGIYFYRAITGNKQIASDKIVVIK